MDRVHGHGRTRRERPQRRDDHRPHRGERHGGVERPRRGVVVAAGPGGAEPLGKLALALRPGEHGHRAAPVQRDLDREVRRGAEAVEPDPRARLDPGDPQRPVADDARTQERRRLEIGERIGEREDVVAPGRDQLGVAPVGRPARELGVRTQVLEAAAAGGTGAVGAV